MGRTCAQCGAYCSNSGFSSNQWRKGDGLSRCFNCVNGGGGGGVSYQCYECSRCFSTQNELNMHMQTHRPRDVACPVCGERRFRSGANAVQHVESGYCSGCRGRAEARKQIHRFASSQPAMQPYMNNVPMLTNGNAPSGVPDYPYQCPQCHKSYRNLSQLMQHQDQKHCNLRMLQY